MNFGLAAGGAGLLGGIPLVSSLLESGLNLYGQDQANKTNKAIADDANASSALQAQKQMDFQERMSNTSYQRGMEDMKKAGLNPILAHSQGGASAPSGAMGDVKTAKIEPLAVSGLSSSAMSAANTALQMRRDDSTIANTDVDTTAKKAQAMNTVANTEKARVQTQNELAAAKRAAEIHHDTSSARQFHKMQAQIDKQNIQHDNMSRRIRMDAESASSVGDAIYSFLPGGKFLKGLMGRGASSAKDLQTAPSRANGYIKVHPKTGEIHPSDW